MINPNVGRWTGLLAHVFKELTCDIYYQIKRHRTLYKSVRLKKLLVEHGEVTKLAAFFDLLTLKEGDAWCKLTAKTVCRFGKIV